MNPTGEQKAFLKKTQVAVLATVDSRGQPHAVPMWCLYEDGEFIMSTGPGSQKYKNIENNQNVVLVFDQRDLPYYAVMVHGTAEMELVKSDRVIRMIAEAYLGKEGTEKYFSRRSGGDSVVIRVKPRKFIEYRGISGRS